MGTPRILEPTQESHHDPWPLQRAAIQDALSRLGRDPAHRERFAPWMNLALHTPADLAQLPFTTRAHLQVDPPLSDHGVPKSDIVRVHASSGTTGNRTISGYTAADLNLWTRMVARGLAALGVDRESVVYSTLAHGLFTGGFGFHQAATMLGATVIPGGQARSATHVDLIRRLQPTVLFSTPSYALHLADRFSPLPPVTLGVFGAEPWSEADRKRLEALWGMRAHDTYGLSEVIGPGVAFECPYGQGMHINSDHFIPEIIDESGTPLPAGTWGELVLTAPTRHARPLIRYRTGDRTRLDFSPCPCGRTLPRMARIRDRVDNMKVVRGVNVRPTDVAEALAAHPAEFGSWLLEVTRPGALDVLTLVAECEESGRPELARDLQKAVRAALGLTVQVRLETLGTLPHTGGKTHRWKDLRLTKPHRT